MRTVTTTGTITYRWRRWKCDNPGCKTELYSELDDDTFIRIPSFNGCPICGRGNLVKDKDYWR